MMSMDGTPEKSDQVVVSGLRIRKVRAGALKLITLYDEYIDAPQEPERLVAEAGGRTLGADALTFLQRLPDTRPRFAFFMEWDNLAVLELSTFDNWFSTQVHKNTRNKIRKAERCGVRIEVEEFSDELVDGLVGVFNETEIRRGRRNAYYGRDRATVRREWATELERSVWLCAYHDGELIGFIKLVLGEGIARTSGTVAKECHRDKAPMNALFARAVEICVGRGLPLLVYGHYTYGHKGEDSLTAFKAHNGFRRVMVPRYYVPLSLLGRIGLHVGLHRRPHEMLPGVWLRWALSIRARWYADVSRAHAVEG
jgi:hypothetical protein